MRYNSLHEIKQMCNFQQLYFNEDGYIIRCKSCNHYQVAFLSSLLNFTEPDFNNFKTSLIQKSEEFSDHYDDSIKSILLKTATRQSYVLLSLKELH